MPKITLYHNPRCSKSRQTLQLLQQQQVEPNIVLYMDDPLDEQTLRRLLQLLKMSAQELIRNKETLFSKLALADANEAQLISAMCQHPQLIERPIVVNGNRAALGRPPETVLEIL